MILRKLYFEKQLCFPFLAPLLFGNLILICDSEFKSDSCSVYVCQRKVESQYFLPKIVCKQEFSNLMNANMPVFSYPK